MKPEVNAVLQEVKAQLANPKPTMPDFKAMSIMESTKWCLLEGGIDKPSEIAKLTGKKVNTIHTAMWKLRNPKRVKVLQRRAKKAKAIKAGIIPTPKAKPTKIKKPTITNGQYDDGMDTPYRDAIQRRGGSFVLPQSLAKATRMIAEKNESELVAENRRLKILVEHYETLLFKGGK
jgi:hypothetical protein